MILARAILAAVLVTFAACSSDGGESAEVATDADAATTSTSAAPSTAEADIATPTTPAPVPSSPGAGAGPATTVRPPTTAARSGTSTTRAPSASATTTAAPPTTAGTAPPTGPTAAITIQNFAFSPPVLNVAAGTTVTATNRDSAPHSWTADNGSWDSGTLGQNGTFSHTFATAGTFPYHCTLHTSMKATVNVS